MTQPLPSCTNTSLFEYSTCFQCLKHVPKPSGWQLESLPGLTPDREPHVGPREESLQDCNCSCGEYQRELIGESFFFSNDGCSVFFLLRAVHDLDRLPVSDVPGFSLAEDPIQHSCRAKKPDMAAVQGRQRAPTDVSF